MYDYDEFVDTETILEEANLAARRAVIAMDTQIQMANLNGKSAAIRAVMEGAEDADEVAEAYFESSNKTANNEKKVGLIRKVLNKVGEVVTAIKNFIKEKILHIKTAKIPDNKPCIVKRGWIKFTQALKGILEKLKKFLVKHRKGVGAVLGTAAIGALTAIGLKVTASKKGMTTKELVTIPFGKVKQHIKFLNKHADDVQDLADEADGQANAGEEDGTRLSMLQRVGRILQSACNGISTATKGFLNAALHPVNTAKTAKTRHTIKKNEKSNLKKYDGKYGGVGNPTSTDPAAYESMDIEDYLDGDIYDEDADIDALLAEIDDDEYVESYDYDEEMAELFDEDVEEYDEDDDLFDEEEESDFDVFDADDEEFEESYDDDREPDAADMLNAILSL